MPPRDITDTTDARSQAQTHNYQRDKAPPPLGRPPRSPRSNAYPLYSKGAADAEPSALFWGVGAHGTWTPRETRSSADTPAYPVVAGNSRDASKPPRTVHILGNDPKARFLAMELQPLYDSVTLLKSLEGRMVDFEVKPRSDAETPQAADTMEKQEPPPTSDTHISNLITTGPAVDAVRRIGRIKHRITDQTALCLMHEGLGVAEELNETVFNQDKDSTPEYVLGNLDPRRLIPDQRSRRRTSADESDFAPEAAGLIHVDPNLRTRLIPIDPVSSKSPTESLFASALIDTLKTSPRLNAQLTPFHKWLDIKLQAMIFTTVVDPVSVVVGCRYDEIAKIKWGMSLMVMLLDEIQRVVAVLPELHQSPLLRGMVERETLRKVCFTKLRSMKPTPSHMAATISRGQKVDIDSFNGYFIRRGKKLGIECPYNEMVVAMIKARQGMRMKELDELVPFEITSRPHRGLY